MLQILQIHDYPALYFIICAFRIKCATVYYVDFLYIEGLFGGQEDTKTSIVMMLLFILQTEVFTVFPPAI